jgi:hypothetical protein
VTQEMYVSAVQGARAAGQIGIRLAEELDEWARSQESPDWQRFEGSRESWDGREVEQ